MLLYLPWNPSSNNSWKKFCKVPTPTSSTDATTCCLLSKAHDFSRLVIESSQNVFVLAKIESEFIFAQPPSWWYKVSPYFWQGNEVANWEQRKERWIQKSIILKTSCQTMATKSSIWIVDFKWLPVFQFWELVPKTRYRDSWKHVWEDIW